MKEIVIFCLVCSFTFRRGTPQKVVSLVVITFITGLVALFYSRTIWLVSLFLVGIVGGLVVLIRFTFIIFPEERFKENKKLLQLKGSFLLPLLFTLFCYVLWRGSDPLCFLFSGFWSAGLLLKRMGSALPLYPPWC